MSTLGSFGFVLIWLLVLSDLSGLMQALFQIMLVHFSCRGVVVVVVVSVVVDAAAAFVVVVDVDVVVDVFFYLISNAFID